MADRTTSPRSTAPSIRKDAKFARRRVIVVGFGPPGRVAARHLEAAGLDVAVIDRNPETVGRLQSRRDMILGDARDPTTLRAAGIDRAEAILLTMPDEDQALEACKVARALNPGVFIVARTNFLSKGLLCRQAGADHVVVEEVVTAEAMEKAAAAHLLRRPGS